MTLTAILGIGWLIFVIVGLLWFLLQFLKEAKQRKLTTPKRNALYVLLFSVASFIWLTVIVFSYQQRPSELGAEDLICALIFIPVIALSSLMVCVAGRRRNRMLAKQTSPHTETNSGRD
jgi:hypothetical protein